MQDIDILVAKVRENQAQSGKARKVIEQAIAALQMQIEQTCDDVQAMGWDIETGWGRVNAYNAVATPVVTVASLGQISNLVDGVKVIV
jgi:hypothetical protein